MKKRNITRAPTPGHRVWPFPYMAVFTRLHPPYLGVLSPQDAKRPNSRENVGNLGVLGRTKAQNTQISAYIKIIFLAVCLLAGCQRASANPATATARARRVIAQATDVALQL